MGDRPGTYIYIHVYIHTHTYIYISCLTPVIRRWRSGELWFEESGQKFNKIPFSTKKSGMVIDAWMPSMPEA
jgi:hypothetical protein